MIKKSLVLFTAVIMGATSLTNAAEITVTNKDKNSNTGPKGSTVYVKVGSTVKAIKKNGWAKFTVPTSATGYFSITASKTGSVANKKLTGTSIFNTKMTIATAKGKPKVQIDVTNKKVTAKS